MCLKLSIRKECKQRLTAKDITLMALMIAIIEVSKIVLAQIPNVELTSFWIVMFTLYFGAKIFYIIPVFILIEGVMFGFGLWWIMYTYAWPILALVTLIFRKKHEVWDLAIVSGVFGLLFGFFCAIPYIFLSGISGAIGWWIAGIPWDLVHGVANFLIMLVLYKPIIFVMLKLKNTEEHN